MDVVDAAQEAELGSRLGLPTLQCSLTPHGGRSPTLIDAEVGTVWWSVILAHSTSASSTPSLEMNQKNAPKFPFF